MYKIVALIGESGSGKDTILKKLIEVSSNLEKITRCTTRPKREGEFDEIDYYFLKEEQFFKFNFIEWSCFREWYYGTAIETLQEDKINIGVFDPNSIRQLESNPNVDLMVFHVRASDKVRLLRSLNREKWPDIDEIIRRYQADEKDFKDLGFEVTDVINETPHCRDEAVEKILSLIESWATQGQN